MLTLPNFLTLLRILAIPVVVVLLTREAYAPAFIVFMLAGVTDAVDGAIARIMDSKSDLGALLDPMADKLLMVSSFVVLAINKAIPLWIVALVISRDMIIVTGYAMMHLVYGEAMKIAPTRLGKANTFFELFTIAFVVMHLARPVLPLEQVTGVVICLTALTSAASCVQYVYAGLLWQQRRGKDEG